MADKPKNDGGPAFPVTGDNHAHGWGMSLRDYFAGQERTLPPCLQKAVYDHWDFHSTDIARFLGMIVDEHSFGTDEFNCMSGDEIYLACVKKWRFQCADAMLEARDA